MEAVLPYLELADLVLVMSVRPGFGGQKLITETLDKVRELTEVRKERGLYYQLEVDGGVHLGNLRDVISAGVDIIVAGTAVFDGNVTENIRKVKEVIEDAS